MRCRRLPSLLALAFVVAAVPAVAEEYGIGRVVSPQEIAGWDIDAEPNGDGLPPGSGSVKDGEQIYLKSCAICHGQRGKGAPMDALVGGRGTLTTPRPIKTVGSYWPYASTLFDYIRRAMPFDHPQSLTPDQVYAVSGYILYLNSIVPMDAVMNAKTLQAVQMPNRNGFIVLVPAGK
jgi:cytochrome c